MSKQPKKVVEAFTAAGITVGTIQLREFSAATMLMLQKIESPLVCGLEKRTLTDLDIMRVVYILATPAQDCFRLIASGLPCFDDAVVGLMDTLPFSNWPKMGQEITKLFVRAMSTAPGAGSSEKKSITTPSPQSRQEAPVSAGS